MRETRDTEREKREREEVGVREKRHKSIRV